MGHEGSKGYLLLIEILYQFGTAVSYNAGVPHAKAASLCRGNNLNIIIHFKTYLGIDR